MEIKAAVLCVLKDERILEGCRAWELGFTSVLTLMDGMRTANASYT
jgi:hypothetical protein